MTDEQIVKALECCIKSVSLNDCEVLQCPACDENGCFFMRKSTEYYPESLIQEMGKAGLDLINRQKAEIINRTEEYNDMLEQRNKVEEALEVMTMDVNSLTSERDALQEMVKEQKAEIERLKEYETALKKGCALSRCINKGFVQDEAYKEFAERLHQKCAIDRGFAVMPDDAIEITYKELTEGGNEPPKNDFKE